MFSYHFIILLPFLYFQNIKMFSYHFIILLPFLYFQKYKKNLLPLLPFFNLHKKKNKKKFFLMVIKNGSNGSKFFFKSLIHYHITIFQ